MNLKQSTLSVRAPLAFDRHRMDLRRGFLDVHTPRAHLHELHLPLREQRALVLSWIAELVEERRAICGRLGKKAGTRQSRKNLNYKLNTKPHLRNRVRSLRTQREVDTDRFIDCGREILLLQELMVQMKQPDQGGPEHGR